MTQEGVSASQVARRILQLGRRRALPRRLCGNSQAFAINAAGWPALWAAQRWLGVT